MWDDIILSGGDSPTTPRFLADNAYADDLFWGIFISNLNIITPFRPEGWSGAPVDLYGGVVPCDDEISKEFCLINTFPVGHLVDNKGRKGE